MKNMPDTFSINNHQVFTNISFQDSDFVQLLGHSSK